MSGWSVAQIEDLQGKVVIVTGGNSGLGYESVKELAAKGAEVIMASRNASKAEAAIKDILAAYPNANIKPMALDLADLSSVRAFSEAFHEDYDRLDILMNNAGIMAIPQGKTADGFEMQFGTNHLGHFALTGLLLDLLIATPGSRVVTMTSLAADMGRVDFRDLQWENKRYSRWLAYGQSKLSNMLFGRELQKRLEKAGVDTISVLAHPGFSSTNLQDGPTVDGGLIGDITKKVTLFLSQSQSDGALPQLRAATANDVSGGEYYGPSGLGQRKGRPVKVRFPLNGKSDTAAARLWEESVQLTGVDYAALN